MKEWRPAVILANKVWNASRFIMMNMDGKTIPQDADRHLQPVDKWILSKLNNVDEGSNRQHGEL